MSTVDALMHSIRYGIINGQQQSVKRYGFLKKKKWNEKEFLHSLQNLLTYGIITWAMHSEGIFH